MKKLLLILLCIPIIGFGQSFKTIKEYSFKNKITKDNEVLLSTKFYLNDKSIAIPEVIIYAYGNTPNFRIPFEKLNDLREFLEKSRAKFYEWDSVRVVNGIKDMKKNIDKFSSPINAIGDDYGVFYGITTLETNYIAWKSGRSVMQLYFSVSDKNNVRSDIFAQYIVKSDDKKSNKTFQKFLDDLNIEFYQKELNKINEKGSLFE
ncbi:MAG: hypothetical protein HN564_04550 [Flavobacteriales bacterium]|jgi:hypothetical protein|nr:hypothetical protein [Flavobacteriales bacterium]